MGCGWMGGWGGGGVGGRVNWVGLGEVGGPDDPVCVVCLCECLFLARTANECNCNLHPMRMERPASRVADSEDCGKDEKFPN